jgi:thymidylate synthase|tara:strand:+ start:773 stop:1939 length:1167 start_codon:yes stop_codon:yes gene_type:complete
MHLSTRNVNTAFQDLVRLFDSASTNKAFSFTESRNGPVTYLHEPVTVTIERPTERVLINRARDCNPFFHLFESLWMLAGRDDVLPLSYYNSKIKDFSDNGATFNGAYGYRWRQAYLGLDGYGNEIPCVDQLQKIIEHLQQTPNSRRAVLQMWDVESDLLKVDGEDFSKDVCCNTEIMFAIRQTCETEQEWKNRGAIHDRETGTYDIGRDGLYQCCEYFLDMTVINRSNDLVWGMLGANVVHFSMLLEWMAAQLDVQVGKMHTVSNNLHAYDWNWKPEEWLQDGQGKLYQEKYPETQPLGKIETEDIIDFVEQWSTANREQKYLPLNTWDSFLRATAWPLMTAFTLHKKRRYEDAFFMANTCVSEDWRIVAIQWLAQRQENWKEKQDEA